MGPQSTAHAIPHLTLEGIPSGTLQRQMALPRDGSTSSLGDEFGTPNSISHSLLQPGLALGSILPCRGWIRNPRSASPSTSSPLRQRGTLALAKAMPALQWVPQHGDGGTGQLHNGLDISWKRGSPARGAGDGSSRQRAAARKMPPPQPWCPQSRFGFQSQQARCCQVALGRLGNDTASGPMGFQATGKTGVVFALPS